MESGAASGKGRLCPSVLKDEPCWAISKGRACNYDSHDKPANPKPLGQNGAPILTNVYVAHLPLTTTKEQLEEMFSPFGEISESKLLEDPHTKERKGVAFVHFTTNDSAIAAIEARNGMEVKADGKSYTLECRLAKPNVKAGTKVAGGRRDDRGSGYGRDNYGGRYGPDDGHYGGGYGARGYGGRGGGYGARDGGYGRERYDDRDYDPYGPDRGRGPAPRGRGPYDRPVRDYPAYDDGYDRGYDRGPPRGAPRGYGGDYGRSAPPADSGYPTASGGQAGYGGPGAESAPAKTSTGYSTYDQPAFAAGASAAPAVPSEYVPANYDPYPTR